nr:hypothetical protein [Mycolicibacterium septicum]
MNRYLTNTRQSDRPCAPIITNPDCCWPTLGMPIAQPKSRRIACFLLESRETNLFALSPTGARIRPTFQPPAQVDSGLLEDLLTHLIPPRQPSNFHLSYARLVDGENAARIPRSLPSVKRINQIKTRPRRISRRVRAAFGKRGFHHRQTLIESKPRRASMLGQHSPLLDGRVQAELERGVATHLTAHHATHH